MLIKLENGIPTGGAILESNFRQLFKNISFPTPLTPEAVEPFGFGIYAFQNKPIVDRYEQAVEAAPVKDEGGTWRQQWQVKEMTDGEKREVDDNQGKIVRFRRDNLLLSSDWTQLVDAPLDSTPWATYRQALRDITDQPGFPHNVTWPEEPTT